jgi:hypothetical protein
MIGTTKINKLEETSRFLGENQKQDLQEDSKEFTRELLNEDFSDIEAFCRSEVSFFEDSEEFDEAEMSKLESDFEKLVEP